VCSVRVGGSLRLLGPSHTHTHSIYIYIIYIMYIIMLRVYVTDRHVRVNGRVQSDAPSFPVFRRDGV